MDASKLDLENTRELELEKDLDLFQILEIAWRACTDETKKQLSHPKALWILMSGMSAGGTSLGYFNNLKIEVSVSISYNPKIKEELEEFKMQIDFAKMNKEMEDKANEPDI